MPIVYLEPGDLAFDQAQRVLDFLNRASSAKQLGRDIEFPDERDIGVRLGQRLLDARAALGGAFTDIRQVRAVRLIGPERFTEICVAALGLDIKRWVELFYGAAPLAPQTETGLIVAIELRPQPAWLGQPLALSVFVRDRGGGARMGVPVAVHTGLGRLVAMYGFSRIEGEAITVITGADGSADLELLVEPSEPLSQIQQSALEHALGGLDAKASDPQKIGDALAAMVDTYLQERSYNLRRAVDVWVRDQRDAMVDPINPSRWAFAWPMKTALLQADALAADGSGGTLARAVATANIKNWVGAWLLALDAQLRRSGQIDEALAGAGRGADGETLGRLLGQAQRFVAAQPGRAAEWLGGKQVKLAVRDLLSSDLSELDTTVRAELLTQLEVAAVEVRPTSMGSYTLVSQTRKDLVKKIDTIPRLQAGDLQQLSQLQGLVESIDRKAALIDAQTRQIDALAATVRGERETVIQQIQLFNQQRVQLGTRIDALQTDLQNVNRRITPLFNRPVGGAVAAGAASAAGPLADAPNDAAPPGTNPPDTKPPAPIRPRRRKP